MRVGAISRSSRNSDREKYGRCSILIEKHTDANTQSQLYVILVIRNVAILCSSYFQLKKRGFTPLLKWSLPICAIPTSRWQILLQNRFICAKWYSYLCDGKFYVEMVLMIIYERASNGRLSLPLTETKQR